ncbi:MAG: membrane protein insertion efficiency factor YidD [Clostridia bacterium]|nr:membrane protein insertion efficiency factor YidD [Clostridia bacterium]
MKRILICLVQMYQRFAPDSIRKKCRFEPSCSQYMILSLKKYGLWKGLAKGIDRLKRCNTQDGGFDYP